MFLSLDGTSLVQLVNFAIFFALLNVLFLKPVSAAIRKRRDYINGVVSDYDKYQAEANEIRAHAEQVRSQARRDAEQTLAKARAQASNETGDIASQFSQQVQSTVEAAQRQAAGELEKARAGEEQLVQQLAGAMVDRVVSEVTR